MLEDSNMSTQDVVCCGMERGVAVVCYDIEKGVRTYHYHNFLDILTQPLAIT